MCKKSLRLITAVIVCIVLLAATVGCGQNKQQPAESAQKVSKKIVTLKSIYPGDEPVGLPDVFTELNKKLGQDIGVNISLTWAPWDQYGNKIQMAVAAGEDIDWHWGGSSDLAGNVAKKIVAPIDEYMEKYGKPLYDNINPKLFDTMKIDGKLMGVPSTGNAPINNCYHSAIYREDLRVKYNLPKLESVENMELYLKTIKKNEPTMMPLVSTSFAYTIMLAFGPEDFLGGTNGAVAYKVNDDGTVTLMNIQDASSLRGAMEKVREWYNAGYIPKDILNIGDAQSKLNSGAAAMINGAVMAASEQQAVIAGQIPGAVLGDAPIIGNNKKYILGNGGNAVYLSPTSEYPDQVVQLWAWILTNQENYDLMAYGIKDKHYTIDSNNRINFISSDYANFPSWMFKNMNYLRFGAEMPEDYISMLKNWDVDAEISPLQGFVFNPENVTTELSQVGSVFGSYSNALYSGTVDLAETLPEFDKKLKAAGQEKVLVEVQKQVDAFLKK